MRVALIADIHGNLPARAALLAAARAAGMPHVEWWATDWGAGGGM